MWVGRRTLQLGAHEGCVRQGGVQEGSRAVGKGRSRVILSQQREDADSTSGPWGWQKVNRTQRARPLWTAGAPALVQPLPRCPALHRVLCSHLLGRPAPHSGHQQPGKGVCCCQSLLETLLVLGVGLFQGCPGTAQQAKLSSSASKMLGGHASCNSSSLRNALLDRALQLPSCQLQGLDPK